MPSFRLESQYDGLVVGIDEAGRGPLAGPVVAAAVIIDRTRIKRRLLSMLDDSKQLTPEERERAYAALRESDAVAIGVGAASARMIDRINVLQANFQAMVRAVRALDAAPAFALVDGDRLPKHLPCPGLAVVKGDSKVYSIAAASIVAKVTRDRIMALLGQRYPEYCWHQNAGYGTGIHLEAIARLGATPHHRMSFSPLNRLL
ncbi:MAG: ribonuclease HII [Reyranellaceae bacterium]